MFDLEPLYNRLTLVLRMYIFLLVLIKVFSLGLKKLKIPIKQPFLRYLVDGTVRTVFACGSAPPDLLALVDSCHIDLPLLLPEA